MAQAADPNLSYSPNSPVEGDIVTFTVDGGANYANNRIGCWFGTSLTPDGSFLADPVLFAMGRMDSQGQFQHQRLVPAGLDGLTFALNSFGINPGTGIWQSNISWVTIGSSTFDYTVPSDGTLENVYKDAQRGESIFVSQDIVHTKFDRTDSGPVITVQGNPGCIVSNNDVGGSDTISFRNSKDVHIYDLILECDDRAAVMYNTRTPYKNIHFYNCKIGQASGVYYNYENASGFDGKWGVLSYELDNWVWDGGEIIGIKREHAMYHHNPQAPNPNAPAITVRNLYAKWGGRTGFQCVARNSEGPPGRGNILIENSYYEDFCLEQNGGGSVLTFRGNLDGDVTVKGTTVKLGCNQNLHPSVQGNITGALVMDAGSGTGGVGTRGLYIQDCWFEVGKFYVGSGSARRANVNISDVDHVEITGTTIWNHPGASDALNIQIGSIGSIVLDAQNNVIGDCVFGGQNYNDPNHNGAGYQAMLTAVANDPKVTIINGGSQ